MCGRKTLTKDIQSIIEEMAIESWTDSELYEFFGLTKNEINYIEANINESGKWISGKK